MLVMGVLTRLLLYASTNGMTATIGTAPYCRLSFG